MADRQLIEPDLDFVKKVIGFGGETLKKCFQCATCSVKPGDVLAAIRNYSFMHFSFPSFMGKLLSEGKYLPLLLGFPIVLLLFLLGVTGHLNIPEGEIVFEKFVPHYIVDPVFILVSIFVAISLAIGVTRFWKGMSEGVFPSASKGLSIGDFVKSHVIPTLVDIVKHSKFMDCDRNRFRYLAHLLILYSFAALAVVTGVVFFGIYFLGLEHMLPLAQWNPVKLLANLGAIALITGCTIVISNRLKEDEAKSKSTYLDWVFIIIVYLVAISGLLTEIVRLVNIPVLAYSIYFIHLVLVFYLIAYLPFSKFAHMIYRTVALVYASYSGREK
jgi:quinone-modifying oxidoreductase subunit QmoC